MSNVFVLDSKKRPLEPIHPGRARRLLKEEKAAVYRRYPFTLILKRQVEAPAPAPLRLKAESDFVIDANGDDGRGGIRRDDDTQAIVQHFLLD